MTSTRPEGTRIRTADNIYYLSSIERLRDAAKRKQVLEARAVVCDCEHNLHVDLGIIRGIIPRNECALGVEQGVTRDIAILSRVNKPVCFYVTGFDRLNGANVAILSRRAVQQDYMDKFHAKLRPGDIIDARVTFLESFGAFCDIGCGITSLLPIDSISVSRIPHPSARFAVGDSIRVIVKSFDEKNRITLSHKELLGTWEENASRFHIGETVSGIVRGIEEYGIFVELTPNLAGLAEFTPDAAQGDHASVYIKNIISDKMKFKLVIIDSFAAEYTDTHNEYFFTGNHIDYFRYSPPECDKIIETLF